ncbi:hypothetical protein SAMN05421810_10599 [Amycolatopsis arida]|uniref:DUF7683 domain-containing protein n=1 Tax=Amycolatopsis arida TaxID=587909 RepID=A0A1I5WHI7_9PSEU|nr:hypothetical protein [Amycolatopsis arida]TDX92273.1 hypothetical protein CLV69_105118 [Amycolatopsis arida]SFQ18886.1 hypothetical protein SAMN05421810_10599 [Amycolatopsis arida]
MSCAWKRDCGWELEVYCNSDDSLVDEIQLENVDREKLEQALGISMTTPDGYLLNAEQVRPVLSFVSVRDRDKAEVNTAKFAYILAPCLI